MTGDNSHNLQNRRKLASPLFTEDLNEDDLIIVAATELLNISTISGVLVVAICLLCLLMNVGLYYCKYRRAKRTSTYQQYGVFYLFLVFAAIVLL